MERIFSIKEFMDCLKDNGLPHSWVKRVGNLANQYEGIYDLIEMFAEEDSQCNNEKYLTLISIICILEDCK